MKILYKTMGLGLLSACLCLLCAAPASAKVCFVGEENCTGGGSFENYKDPSKDGSLCTQEGYTSKTSCQADMTKYIAGYCPYNNNYVMCCGREYSYDACVYPLVADGKCGNRFKCRCDSDKYPYKQQSATVCKNTVTGQNYDNSIASGASCVYTGFANGQTSINAYFTECLCDRGLYPKTEEECSKDGSSVSNKSCVDSNGNTYYTACICGDEFKVIASECKYGININEPMCQQGDVLKAKKCCDCNINTYPYGDIEDVEGSSSPVASYASCEKEKGCTRGSRYRATSCKKGYKVVSGECVLLSCSEAIKQYLAETPNSKIVYGDMKGLQNKNASGYVIAEDVSSNWLYRGKSYYGARYYVAKFLADTLMAQSCKDNNPTLTATYSKFDVVSLSTSDSNYYTYFYDLKLNFTNNKFTTNSKVFMYRVNMQAKGIIFNETVTFHPDILGYSSNLIQPAITADYLYLNSSGTFNQYDVKINQEMYVGSNSTFNLNPGMGLGGNGAFRARVVRVQNGSVLYLVGPRDASNPSKIYVQWAMLGEGSNNSKLIVKQNAWYNLKNNQTNEKASVWVGKAGSKFCVSSSTGAYYVTSLNYPSYSNKCHCWIAHAGTTNRGFGYDKRTAGTTYKDINGASLNAAGGGRGPESNYKHARWNNDQDDCGI